VRHAVGPHQVSNAQQQEGQVEEEK
jgi:hypothetical protein